MLRVPSLDSLIVELSRLPGIGQKTAQRLAYHILRSPKTYSEKLRKALQNVENKVLPCPECFSYTENELCHYCADPNRQDDSICVVGEPMDIVRIESSQAFQGRYHVLQGSISPLNGIGPSQLRIRELLEKVQMGLDGVRTPIKEVILALDADLEGDTTVLYLTQVFREIADENQLKLTRIAHGVPIGGDIDYIDHRTLGRALENRVNL